MTEGTVTPATWVEPTRRPVSPGAERWIGQRIAVLDHGYVELLDYMGTDREIVLAARTTTDTEDVKGPAENRRLLRFLVRRRHSTPVEFCRVKVRMQMPVLVARQIIRHRMTSTNEYSLRYSPPIDATYLPELEHVALQATTNRQGRGDALPIEVAARVRELMSAHADASFRLYNELADDLGVARELARSVLPMSLYTRWVWTIDLHNLMHLLGLRLDPHAQLETRVYAEALARIARDWVPEAFAAFEDYRLHAVTFSRLESAALAALFPRWTRTAVEDPADLAREAGEQAGLAGGELDEFTAKIAQVLAAPAFDWVGGAP